MLGCEYMLRDVFYHKWRWKIQNYLYIPMNSFYDIEECGKHSNKLKEEKVMSKILAKGEGIDRKRNEVT